MISLIVTVQYFNEFLGLLGGRIPFQISNPPFEFDQKTNSVVATGAWFNLPAFLISVLITIVLICGVRESTRFNNVMVGLKVSIGRVEIKTTRGSMIMI